MSKVNGIGTGEMRYVVTSLSLFVYSRVLYIHDSDISGDRMRYPEWGNEIIQKILQCEDTR